MSEREAWWEFLSQGQRDLVEESYQLLEWVKETREKFHDYSFAVFPMAKAYEGMLKLWFFKLGLISQKTYEGDRFRVGKALNPDLPERMRGKQFISVEEAEMKVGQLKEAMRLAVECAR